MILHLALFTFVETVTSEDVEALTDDLMSMASQIPQLKGYRAGANVHVRPGGADFGVAALVDDGPALDAYLEAAAHKAVYERWLGWMIAERSAAQLEVPDGLVL